MPIHKQGKKNRKVGRNANSCLRYANSNRLARNKVIRLTKRIASHPNDKSAIAALAHYKAQRGS